MPHRGIHGRATRAMFFLGAALAIFTVTTVARADDDGAPGSRGPCFRFEVDGARTARGCGPVPDGDEEGVVRTSRWYGWQTLIVDGASFVTTPLYIGLGGLVLGGPIVHAAHARWETAVLDLGLRIAMPGLGFLLGTQLEKCPRRESCLTFAAAAGTFFGMGGAIAIDAAVLAREPLVPATDATVRTKDERPIAKSEIFTLQPSISPQLTPQRELHGFSFGVAGTF